MEERMSLDKVMRKLQKLKKLYEGAKAINSEGEANAAASLMNKLLVEYNLSMEEIGEEKRDNEITKEEISGYNYKNIGGRWESRLAYVLCKWNFCRCYTLGSSYKRLLIVGEKHNMENVKWMLDVLREKFVLLSKDRYKEYKKGLEIGEKMMCIDTFQRSYLSGCAAGLDVKLQMERNKDKKEDVEFSRRVTDLVLKKDAALDDFVKKNLGKIGKSHCHEKFNCAREAGYKDGKNTSINRPIAAGNTEVKRRMLI